MKKLHWLHKLEKESRKSLYGIKRKTDPASWGTDTHTPHQFFYELIANADDEGASKAKLIVDNNKMIFQHDGKPFTESDVDNITSYRKRKKQDKLDKIGNFGSGFKTVHQFCNEPEIFTLIDGELIGFKIEEKIIPSPLKISKKEEKKIISEFKKDGPTKFVFRFNNKKNPEKQLLDIKSFKKFLKENNEELLLFLPNIKEIIFKIDNSSFSFKKDINKIDENLFKVSLLNENKYKKYFYLYSEKFSLPGYEKNNKAAVSVAYKYNVDKNKFLQVNNDKNLFVAFRTQEHFEYRFCINAPFRTTESRVSVREENPENKNLLKHCEEVIVNSILKLKENKILNISFFDLLPIEKDKINKRFESIRNKILSIVREEQIWPVKNANEFLKIDKIIFGEPEYIKNFSNEDLSNFSIMKKWLDGPLSGRIKDLLKNLHVDEFNSNNFESYSDWDLILNKKNDKKLFSIYLLLNSKLDHSKLEDLPVVKSENGNFRNGPYLRFPPKNNSQQLNIEFVDKNFLNNKKYPKLKEFFIKCGVIDINLSDVIQTNISNMRLDFNTKINVDTKVYENLLNEIITSKLEFNANITPHLIDENLTCRRGEDLYVDDKIYSTKLSAIYKDFPDLGINKYKIYFPKNIDNSMYLDFLNKLNVQKDLEVKKINFIKDYKLSKHFYSKQGRPTGNVRSYFRDYWLNDLENIISNMTMEKSLFIVKALNNSIKNYHDISESQYRKSLKSPMLNTDSSLISFLKNYEWIPDIKGEFKKPRDLNEETIDKNFYENINNKFLDLIDFNKKDNTRDKHKEILENYGVDSWVIDHPEEVAEAKAKYELKGSDEFKRKKFGKSHRKVLDDDMKMEDNFDNKDFVKNSISAKNISQKNYREQDKQSVKSKYSYHCQMCYGEDYKPNSYSDHAENRRKMSEDAHIVKNSDGGLAINGNLLSLCIYHHLFYGDQITANMVLESIKLDGLKWKNGIIHKIKLLDGNTIDIYFKEGHKTEVIKYLTEYENQKVVNFPSNKK